MRMLGAFGIRQPWDLSPEPFLVQHLPAPLFGFPYPDPDPPKVGKTTPRASRASQPLFFPMPEFIVIYRLTYAPSCGLMYFPYGLALPWHPSNFSATPDLLRTSHSPATFLRPPDADVQAHDRCFWGSRSAGFFSLECGVSGFFSEKGLGVSKRV